MTQYRPYKKPKKIEYIKEQTVAVDTHIENLKKVPDYKALPAKDFYKNAKIIYDSGWTPTEHEKIGVATSTEPGLMLPERALYNYSVPLTITEEFLPYLKVEVLARTNPDIQIEGVYAFHRTAYSPITFALYQWHGVTYTTGCQPFGQPRVSPVPADMYVESAGDPETGAGGGFYFIYPAIDFPIPNGENKTFELPHPELYGHENGIDACTGAEGGGQYWEGGGDNDFMTLVYKFGLQGAKDLVDQYWEDIVYADQTFPYKAFEVIDEERVVTGHQVKTFVKKSDNQFDLIVEGSFLHISEANEETEYSNEQYPTYAPNGGDMEVKLVVYSMNPNVYSERKFYKK